MNHRPILKLGFVTPDLPNDYVLLLLTTDLHLNFIYFLKGFGTDEKALIDILCVQDNKVTQIVVT